MSGLNQGKVKLNIGETELAFDPEHYHEFQNNMIGSRVNFFTDLGPNRLFRAAQQFSQMSQRPNPKLNNKNNHQKQPFKHSRYASEVARSKNSTQINLACETDSQPNMASVSKQKEMKVIDMSDIKCQRNLANLLRKSAQNFNMAGMTKMVEVPVKVSHPTGMPSYSNLRRSRDK